MTTLRIAPDLQLPVDAATGTFAILATKGAGKSNAAVVLAEEMWNAGIPWVAVDPKGDWWGLRSSSDGSGPGLPIIVFGGRHGDLPLEPTAGALIADLVLEQRITCVLDVSQFSKADTIRFLLAFGQHLFGHADDDTVEPIHLFLEEAHEYLPQNVSSKIDGGDIGKLVNVWQRIVKQGRFKGLGVTMISQRSSVLNKDVLELIDTLIVLRTIGPRSRASIKEWVAGQDVDAGLIDSLPGLKDGEAWVWSPGELKIIERVRFRQRRTFDSGATPKVGQTRKAPTTIADVDLAALKEAMAETIEKAKADDPKELRRRIAALERQLREQPASEPERVEIPVEVPYVPDAALDALQGLEGHRYEIAAQLDAAVAALDLLGGAHRAALRALIDSDEPHDRPGRAERMAPTPPAARQRDRGDIPARARPSRPAPTTVDGELSAYAAVLLDALAKRYPVPMTTRQWSVAADRSTTSSGWQPAVRELRAAGYIGQADGDWFATDVGLEVAGVDPGTPPPSGAELVSWWCQRITGPGAGAAQTALRLLASQADPITLDELADLAGWSRTSSGPGGAVTVLVKLGLVERHDGLLYLDEGLRDA